MPHSGRWNLFQTRHPRVFPIDHPRDDPRWTPVRRARRNAEKQAVTPTAIDRAKPALKRAGRNPTTIYSRRASRAVPQTQLPERVLGVNGSRQASADAERRMWPARNPVYDLVGQNDVQERAVHVQPAVVLDEAQLQAPSQINPTR